MSQRWGALQHLKTLLDKLEFCLANGFIQPTLLKTRSLIDFSSSISELDVANHFLKSDFSVQGYDAVKDEKSVPDLFINKNDIEVNCEIYSPRDWDGMDNYFDEIKLSILNLDIHFDFIFNISMRIRNHLDDKGNLLRFDPWAFSDHFNEKTERETEVQRISEIIKEQIIRNSNSRIKEIFEYQELNVNLYIEIKRSQDSTFELPARVGFCSPPTLSGYAPEGMFNNLVKRRLLKKLKKSQTANCNQKHKEIYFINTSRLGYSFEFDHQIYLTKFSKSLAGNLNINELNADIIVFYKTDNKSKTGIDVFIVT